LAAERSSIPAPFHQRRRIGAEVLISGATVINTKTIEAISTAAAAFLSIGGGTITNSGLIDGVRNIGGG
jgi:hypothetical protein